jgi:hypothetical protein
MKPEGLMRKISAFGRRTESRGNSLDANRKEDF